MTELHPPSYNQPLPDLVIHFCADGTADSAAVSEALKIFGRLEPCQRLPGSHDRRTACAIYPLGSTDCGLAKILELRATGFEGPVLFYSSSAPEALRLRALESGAQDVIDPSRDDPDRMRRIVMNAIARHHGAVPLYRERSPSPLTHEPADTLQTQRLEWLLQGVLEVQSLITEAEFDLQAFMQRVVDLAANLTCAKGAVIELVNGDEMHYRCTSPTLSAHVGLRLTRTGSLSGLCVAEARVLRCDDTEQDERVNREACRTVGVRSMICTPLFQSGKAIGVLKVVGAEVSAFDPNDQYLLSLLAGALGAALGKQLTLEALRASEETFRSAMVTASIGMALVKPEGRFMSVNPAICELLGYTEAELLANDFQSITHPEDLERDRPLLEQILKGEINSYRVEKRYYHKSGRTVWALLSVSLVRDRLGNPSYFVSQVQDISRQREVDRIKSEFISVVSHELRTPLTSIRGSLGLVLGTLSSTLPKQARGLLDIAQNNCERLIRLINDILDIDKIASGNMRFDIQERSLAQVVYKAVQATEPYAQRFNVRLELQRPAAHLKVAVDEDRLIQVLSNLLSNAIKFSPQNETVSISVQENNGRVRVSIVDRGPGIPVDFRERIFERFSQADSSATRRAGGTGLGLHISRQIVERMNGCIGFDTEHGRGTTFWIEVPLFVAPVKSVVSPWRQTRKSFLPQILHIEANIDLARVLSVALQSHANVVIAGTLSDAKELLMKQAFALIVLDTTLPDGSGLDVLEHLEAGSIERSAPPVVMLCTDAPPQDVYTRVDAVMVKTRTSEDKIVETILEVLEQSQTAPQRLLTS